MLKSMHITNFTVFKDEVIEFSPAVNVVIGENSVGKTHLLKLAYALLTGIANLGAVAADGGRTESAGPDLMAKVNAVFRPKTVSALLPHGAAYTQAECVLSFADSTTDFTFGFQAIGARDVGLNLLKPINFLQAKSVFLPTRELLSIYKGFVSLYNSRFVSFDETWRDTCDLLGVPLLKALDEQYAAKLLAPIEAAIGGKVVLEDNGEFYLDIPGTGKMEMHMVAEGYRKLAMVAHLVANGMIAQGGYLFWDEPEANLNAKLIKLVANVIVELGRLGVQVFIATHSLFLLRELEILLADKDKTTVPVRYIGLSQGNDGVEVSQGESSADLKEIVALDESIDQASRYLALED